MSHKPRGFFVVFLPNQLVHVLICFTHCLTHPRIAFTEERSVNRMDRCKASGNNDLVILNPVDFRPCVEHAPSKKSANDRGSFSGVWSLLGFKYFRPATVKLPNSGFSDLSIVEVSYGVARAQAAPSAGLAPACPGAPSPQAELFR